ncbi:hypothetical protein ABI_44060 [Asticcacaulis biprosthecium C19]|uniref:STAS domain-containing protein n=1 Tax=Asticcacaulis biprosthecium C19 TaxID=715226 RepID=F4QTA9_9CAUL|nr:STAS domain-containing protein [Asticcacaulis biprosthecium]EGF89979.1 hypothetical protein ABI_44060 [Asticcacaulis biprosthecium C19]
MFVVSLPGVVDTAAVDSLKDCLIAQLQSKASCRLDGGSVERIGTAGLQLLWSAKQSFWRWWTGI